MTLAIVLFLVACLALLALGIAYGRDDDGQINVVDNEEIAAQAPPPGERPKRAFDR